MRYEFGSSDRGSQWKREGVGLSSVDAGRGGRPTGPVDSGAVATEITGS